MSSQKILDYFFKDIENYTKKDVNIIDERYLDDSYIPEDIKFRDKQKKALFEIINHFIKGYKSYNAFLYGPTGTGKTLLSKYIFQGLNAYAIKYKLRIKPVYINCKTTNGKDTIYYVYGKIYEELTNKEFKTGMKKQELIDGIFEYIINKEYKVLLILDEVDSLVKSKELDDFLYLLLRDYNFEIQNKITFFFVTNNVSFLENLDPRVKSSLSSSIFVDFPPYTYQQLKEILLERAKLAFKEGFASEDVISYIAAKVAKLSGDARVAIGVLKLAAFYASVNNRDKITIEDVNTAFENIDSDIIKKAILSMNKEQRIILYSILRLQEKTRDFISTSEIYEEYVKIKEELALTPLSYDSFRKNLRAIELLLENMIESKVISEGKKGYKKIIRIMIDEDKTKKIIEEFKSYI